MHQPQGFSGDEELISGKDDLEDMMQNDSWQKLRQNGIETRIHSLLAKPTRLTKSMSKLRSKLQPSALRYKSYLDVKFEFDYKATTSYN